EIRGFKNVAGGVVPWIRILNDTAVAVDQLGIRKGALSLTLNIYHSDIFDFLNLKTNNGDDRRKAHDIFPSVGVPDNFMRAVKERSEYYLFDPYMVRKYLNYEISDYYGEEFEKRYDQVVADDRIVKTKVAALSIMKMILKSSFETGLPYIFYRDTANKCNPNKHCGVVRSTNLCVEIIQNMSATTFKGTESTGGSDFSIKKEAGDLVVCNLSSLNLMNVNSDEDIERVIPIQVRMLDNVIDLNFYPVKEAEITNRKYRAIGLGTMSYHALLATKGYVSESEEHLEYVDKLYEKISYTTIKSSSELAVEKGTYSKFEGSDWQKGEFFGGRDLGDNQDWTSLKAQVAKDGLRNGYLLAIAPTGSISLISGATAGIDPIFSKIERTEKVNGVIVSAVPELNDATFWLYKEAHKIDQN
ncbi:ribonucleoside-diphosphate reductase subunit alpha, partial [bacterium]|nr:ribonucleoside-diphosphate reductase subunit alpha [bacterium]